MSLSPVHALSLDFWNTLYIHRGTREERARTRAASLERLCHRLGVRDAHSLSETFSDSVHWAVEQQWDGGMVPDRRSIVRACEERYPGVPGDQLGRLFDGLVGVYTTALRPLPVEGGLDFVRWACRVAPVYVVSDTYFLHGEILRELLKVDGFLGSITHAYFSDEIGVRKPDPWALLDIQAREGARGENCVHAGDDDEKDGVAAIRAGVRFVHCSWAGARETAGSVRSFLELQELLRQLWGSDA